jgi:hypothetical protein
MSCKLDDNRPDWKAYALGEMAAPARHEAEAHASSCNFCQDELAGLRLTLDALATLHEEELPRRIGFVSDKVFEPTWWQKWSQTFLRPTFAAGCVIAAAILVHGYMRPVASPNATSSAAMDTAAIEARVVAQVSAEVGQRMQAQMNDAVNSAVVKAVAETRLKDQQQTNELLAATERRYSDATAYLNRQVTQIYALNSGAGVR